MPIQKEKTKSRILKHWSSTVGILFLLAAILIFPAGCTMSDTERQKAGDLVSNQRDSFINQAVRQYGKDTKVKNIKAETRTIYDPLFGVPSERKTTGYLAGDITAGKETFRGVYSSEIGEIYSDKNYRTIIETAKTFLGLTESQVLDVTLTDSAYQVYYLPDQIETFEDMLNHQYFMLIHVYTTEELSDVKKEDFSQLYQFYEKYEESTGYVTVIQLKDGSDLETLRRDINSITFEYENHHGTVYDNETHDYVDAFDKYHIEGALYLSKMEFIYND